MLQFLRLAVFGFLFLSILYVGVSIYSRVQRWRKLKRDWAEQGMEGDFDAYMREGLEEYDSSLRRKLILLIYIVPVVGVITIIYIMNFS